MSEDQIIHISSLYGESNLFSKIFLQLELSDLLSTEFVSKEWKSLMVQENIWRKKIGLKEKTYHTWKHTLSQHDTDNLNHLKAKKLYFQISSVIIPEKIIASSEIEKWIKTVSSLKYKVQKSEESLFFDTRRKDLRFWCKNLPRNIVLNKDIITLSRLIVLSHKSGDVTMAGAYYGNGKVVVLPHENGFLESPLAPTKN